MNYLIFVVILFVFDDAVGTKEKPCNNSTECGCNQCCVSNTRPIGRRKRSTEPIGKCRSMGRKGSACLVNNEKKDITGSFFVSCPCMSPFKCIPDGNIDIPLGPTGLCGIKQ